MSVFRLSTLPVVRDALRATLIAFLMPAAAAAQTTDAGRAERADRIMAQHARADEPGVVAAVVRDGTVVYSRAIGLASLEQRAPLTTATILDIGSVSKQFTAFALVLLESQGRLSLEDDIRTHLPEVPDFGQRITIRNLLNHTGGLREIYNTKMIGGWQSGDAMTQEQALDVVVAQPELQFTPGSEHLYNNTGYMLLADIVERVTGEEFHEWMHANVFRPLGMNRTVIMHTLGQVIPGSADSYAPVDSGGFLRVFDNSTIQGAGGIYSTVEDMALWLGHWSDPVVGTKAVLERMQERAVLTAGDTLGYALGVNVGRQRGLRRIQHGGSSAAYRTALIHYPELEGGIIVQSNNAATNAGRLATELAEVFFGDRMQPTPVAPGEPGERGESATRASDPAASDWRPSPAELTEYAGRFYSDEVAAVYDLTLNGDTLVVHHERIGELRLRPRSRDLFGAGSSTISELRFIRDDAGRVTGFTVANGRTRGVRFVSMP